MFGLFESDDGGEQSDGCGRHHWSDEVEVEKIVLENTLFTYVKDDSGSYVPKRRLKIELHGSKHCVHDGCDETKSVTERTVDDGKADLEDLFEKIREVTE